MGENEIPEVYIDQMRLTIGVFGVSVTFSLSEPHPTSAGAPKPEDKVRVRMSLEHAKVVAMLLRKQLKQYEENSGTKIAIPARVYTALGVAEEDWGL
ncbi:hypothetical protein LCGC14_2861400 [marine sediment metagenome]|uniref:DUF3467 domain-containing protein n=1 Tax=marine sediment metagenome TaxID=412755 RepID=A0A0F9AWQ3_9ZZZZ